MTEDIFALLALVVVGLGVLLLLARWVHQLYQPSAVVGELMLIPGWGHALPLNAIEIVYGQGDAFGRQHAGR